MKQVSLMKRLTAWDRQSWSALAAPSYPRSASACKSSSLTSMVSFRTRRRQRARCARIRSGHCDSFCPDKGSMIQRHQFANPERRSGRGAFRLRATNVSMPKP
jgi:hypothetical protein